MLNETQDQITQLLEARGGIIEEAHTSSWVSGIVLIVHGMQGKGVTDHVRRR